MVWCMVLLVAFLAGGPAAHSQAAGETVESLVEPCGIAARFPSLEAMQKASAGQDPEAVRKAAYCYGYFAGVLDLNRIYSGMSHPMFCPPDTGFSVADAIKLFLSYVQERPQFRKEKSISIVVSSLADSLPCH